MTWIEDANECSGSEFILEPFHRNIPNDDLFQNIADMWRRLGRQPKFRDCYPGLSRFSAQTYACRFGSWRSALSLFIDWTKKNGVNAESIPQLEPARHRTPRSVNLKLRAEVLMRDFSTCQLCGAQPKDGVRLVVDHIIPWANGGETLADNLQTLCEDCNCGKSDSRFYDSNADALADMKRLAEGS